MKMADNRECFRQLNLMAARGWVASKPAVSLARFEPHLYTDGQASGRDRVFNITMLVLLRTRLRGYYNHCLTPTSSS